MAVELSIKETQIGPFNVVVHPAEKRVPDIIKAEEAVDSRMVAYFENPENKELLDEAGRLSWMRTRLRDGFGFFGQWISIAWMPQPGSVFSVTPNSHNP